MGCPHEGLALLVAVHTRRGRRPRRRGSGAAVARGLTMALRGKRRPRHDARRRRGQTSGARALLRTRDRGVLVPRRPRRRRLHMVLRLHLRRLQDLRLHRGEARRRMQRRLLALRLYQIVLLVLVLRLRATGAVPVRPPLLLELLLLLLVRRARRRAQHLEVDYDRPPVRAEVLVAFAHQLRVVCVDVRNRVSR